MEEGFDYPEMLRVATLGLVREVLDRAAEEGLPGEHHFFLTFNTRGAGVDIPSRLLLQYPETMTIVLQHQYEELTVEEDGFEVSLRFGGSWERLRIPFDALTSFLDPSVPFGLDFAQFEKLAGGAGDGEVSGERAPATTERDSGDPGARRGAGEGEGEEPEPGGGGDVLPFRRK